MSKNERHKLVSIFFHRGNCVNIIVCHDPKPRLNLTFKPNQHVCLCEWYGVQSGHTHTKITTLQTFSNNQCKKDVQTEKIRGYLRVNRQNVNVCLCVCVLGIKPTQTEQIELHRDEEEGGGENKHSEACPVTLWDTNIYTVCVQAADGPGSAVRTNTYTHTHSPCGLRPFDMDFFTTHCQASNSNESLSSLKKMPEVAVRS